MKSTSAMRWWLAGGAVVIAVAVTVQAQNRDDRYDRFSRAYGSADPVSVAALYTQNALYLGPSGDIVQGRATIQEHYAQAFGERRGVPHTRSISFDFVDRVGGGDLRTDVGHYTITVYGVGHNESFRGKFVKVWRRETDGVWRIHTDSYSPAK